MEINRYLGEGRKKLRQQRSHVQHTEGEGSILEAAVGSLFRRRRLARPPQRGISNNAYDAIITLNSIHSLKRDAALQSRSKCQNIDSSLRKNQTRLTFIQRRLLFSLA